MYLVVKCCTIAFLAASVIHCSGNFNQNNRKWGNSNQNNRNLGNSNQNTRNWGNSNQNNRNWGNSNQNNRNLVNSNQNIRNWGNSNQNTRNWGNSNQNNRNWGNSNQYNRNLGTSNQSNRNWGNSNQNSGNWGDRNNKNWGNSNQNNQNWGSFNKNNKNNEESDDDQEVLYGDPRLYNFINPYDMYSMNAQTDFFLHNSLIGRHDPYLDTFSYLAHTYTPVDTSKLDKYGWTDWYGEEHNPVKTNVELANIANNPFIQEADYDGEVVRGIGSIIDPPDDYYNNDPEYWYEQFLKEQQDKYESEMSENFGYRYNKYDGKWYPNF